jgi:hypothetical protein
MPWNNSAKTDALGAVRAAMTHISLHTAYPGDSGASETSGGSPAYARQPVTWGAVAGSPPQFDVSAALTFDVAAGINIKWVGGFTALTAGTFKGAAPLGSTLRGVATVQQSDDIFRSDAHGLPNDRRVVFYPVAGEALPAGLTEGTDYFVVSSTTDTFQVSATQGGAALNLTGDGEVRWQDMVPATDAAQFKVEVTSFLQNLEG